MLSKLVNYYPILRANAKVLLMALYATAAIACIVWLFVSLPFLPVSALHRLIN